MATSDSTSDVRAIPKTAPVEAVYFDCPEDAPRVHDLLMALEGVTGALDQEQIQVGDHDQIDRVACLSTAAFILARQLNSRLTTKPLSKKRLEKGRQERAEWLAQREKLAGPPAGAA